MEDEEQGLVRSMPFFPLFRASDSRGICFYFQDRIYKPHCGNMIVLTILGHRPQDGRALRDGCSSAIGYLLLQGLRSGCIVHLECRPGTTLFSSLSDCASLGGSCLRRIRHLAVYLRRSFLESGVAKIDRRGMVV